MPKEEKVCPKCKGKMELGELIDESYAVSVAQKWAKYAGGILGIGRSEGIPILSYRCVECGFLENYAPSKVVETKGDELPFGYNR